MGYKGQRWDEREDRVLRRYYRSMGAPWCAMVLGRTKSGVNQRARKIGVTGVPYTGHASLTPDQVKAIRENRHGWTQRQWAEKLGVHQNTVWQAYNRATYIRVS